MTVTFAILTLLTLLSLAISENIWFAVLLLLELGLLIPYIRHYFILENGVHKLYGYYDRLVSSEI